MIVDARSLPQDTHLQADVAVIGAGPAGITLAHELLGSGLTVLMLEAGGLKADSRQLDSFRGEVSDPARHPPVTLYRVRALGGTTTLWGGRCVKLDPIDFEPRPHIPFSGWPIGHDEMLPWYRRANAYCEAGPFRYSAAEALPADAPPLVPGVAGPEVSCDSLERFSPPTDFGRRYRAALKAAPEVTVLLSAACTRIEAGESGREITRLACAGRPGHWFSVGARWIVLAAGALEAARLMLASRLGGDLVGRFYMCHLEGKAAVARFVPGTRVMFQYERDRDGIYLRRRFSIPADIQRRDGLTNVVLRFEPPVIADPAHGDPVLSAMWLSRTFLKREYARKLASFGYRGAQPDLPGGLAARHSGLGALTARHLGNVLRGAPALARFGADWTARHVLASRKLPYVAVAGRDGAFSLDYNAEQVPHPASRVVLGDEVDAHGLPRLRVEWRATGLDIDSVLATHRLLAARLEQAAVGRLDLDEEAVRQGYNATGGHHIGTLRMAGDATLGVVDHHCRVFGVDNLFVAGSAVFPTSGHANPTLTLVALAARLAAHLRMLARRPAGTAALAEAAE